MNSTSDKKKPTNELADRIAGFNDPSMGDERERDVILRAYTFGAVVSTYAFFALALIFAVIGAGLWTVPIVLASGVTGAATAIYCRREGVDFKLVAARIAPKRLITSYIIGAIFTAGWLVAVIFHVTSGHPLIDAGLGSMLAVSDGGSSLIMGAAIGIVVVIALNTVTRSRKIKQARAEAAAAADIADVD
ncbi:hypothetical protein [Brevibacterium oceani]|uniref:hypothetical protein n=1 Tax=Brevibacterium oceani TaxID=358099 RepID=UPI001B340EBE|nr:hypothetical protein [Brevibacterium oceani]